MRFRVRYHAQGAANQEMHQRGVKTFRSSESVDIAQSDLGFRQALILVKTVVNSSKVRVWVPIICARWHFADFTPALHRPHRGELGRMNCHFVPSLVKSVAVFGGFEHYS